MKKPFNHILRATGPVALAAFGLLTLPLASQAKDHHDDNRGHDSKHHKSHRDDHGRSVYLSHPRSSFTLAFGTGYAGRGYYYGPQNSPYYYERPDVRFYATREAAPREYYTRGAYPGNTAAAVQNALARRGYYQGFIDGDIGPQSRRAIARYQADHGLRATGVVSSSLLRSLGL